MLDISFDETVLFFRRGIPFFVQGVGFSSVVVVVAPFCLYARMSLAAMGSGKGKRGFAQSDSQTPGLGCWPMRIRSR